MIYSFTIERLGPFAGNLTSEIAQPLWSLPLAEARTDRGGLSQGLFTPFVLTTRHRVIGLVIPHRRDQEPHLIQMMELDRHAEVPTCVGGFEKAFIQHTDRSVSRLSFSWDGREVGGVDPWLMGTCTRAVSRNYPPTFNGARLPKFDEETGRLVQDSAHGIWVGDTSLAYTNENSRRTSN